MSRTAFEPGFRKSIDPGPASLGPGSIDGGQSGIRTHGRLPYTRFPSVLLKPLRHLSIVEILRAAEMLGSEAFARKTSSTRSHRLDEDLSGHLNAELDSLAPAPRELEQSGGPIGMGEAELFPYRETLFIEPPEQGRVFI